VLRWQIQALLFVRVLANVSGSNTGNQKELTALDIRSAGAAILPPSGTRSPSASAHIPYI
jgi:hypothetical protein